ncbi:MAG: 4Fe-4S dicluster domain-containing protein [Candidatus Omnitrophota bacterium]|nr:4Fe-4S dicluster domain-containing protein [Candidatus Omnitrophota bacterium]MBU2528434.1 4Fe-4S dicluster domain-containing protein [bacterium]MBU3930777.1 4Fe-4S dicluster domain-containing protein [bacterium]
MKIIYISPEKCLACRSCQLACAVAHSKSRELAKAIAEEPRPAARISVIGCDDVTLPLQCRHCEDAPCVAVCPSGALSKEENGIVFLDSESCIGCDFCVIACPFGVIKTNREGKAVIKCDLCRERLKQGEEPACAAACPTKALVFVEPTEISREKTRRFLTEFKK